MSEKIITSENSTKPKTKATIVGDKDKSAVDPGAQSADNLKERIRLCTLSKGLQSIPADFDNTDGDWQCIKSDNPFEILFLDYKLYKLITPEIVAANYNVLEKFWKDKQTIMMTGGNRLQFNKKYGENTVDNALGKLQNCYKKISTAEGIENYYHELNNARINKGLKLLEDRVNDMFSDGVVSPDEIKPKLDDAGKYNLEVQEVAAFILSVIQKKKFLPYGEPAGLSEEEKLLSVSWMSNEKLIEFQKKEEEAKKHGREIFEGQFAYSLEDIGELMFKNETQAKEYLADNLIVNSIDYFSTPKAKQVKDIFNTKHSIQLKYLKVVYTLNHNLPYRFKDRICTTPKELAGYMLLNTTLAKDHLKSGYIEAWTKECHQNQFDRVNEIIRNAENIDLALLEIIYTFDPSLPYLLGKKQKVTTPLELCTLIDSDMTCWNLGVNELFDKSIITWLTCIGKKEITGEWIKVQDLYQNKKNEGMEAFLHLLNPSLPNPLIKIEAENINYPKIQSLRTVSTVLKVVNITRGYVSVAFVLNKKTEGLVIKPEVLILHHVGKKEDSLKFDIDPNYFKRGDAYSRELKCTTKFQPAINIPVNFRIAFPKAAFLIHLAKTAILFAVLAACARGLLTLLGFDSWLFADNNFFLETAFLDLDINYQYKIFPVVIGLFIILGYFINKLYRKYIFP